MFGNGFYNPYMYQPYYQASNIARNLGGLANNGIRNSLGGMIGNSVSRSMGNAIGNTLGNSSSSGLAGGLGKGLFSKFSFSNFLTGASKTLNVVNQAIPIFYQVRPMINNAKTMFRIMGAIKDDDNTSKNYAKQEQNNSTISNSTSHDSTQKEAIINEKNQQTENPVFFI